MRKELQKRIVRVAKVLEKLGDTVNKSKKIASSPRDFLNAYLEAMLWASTDDDGDSLDKNYSFGDIADEAMAKIKEDCEKFLDEADDLIDGEYEQAGHDFFLTRNGHGAGFWDGDWKEPAGDALTKLSKKFGEQDLYIGDDEKIYVYPH